MSTAAPSVADPFDAGPFARLYLARPGARSAATRAVTAAAVAWLPLAVLAAAQGLALRPSARESFLLDVASHVRYLVALPLLIAAEPWCLPRLAAIARHFASAGLVAEGERPRYDALIASARRLLDHRGMEVVLAAVAYVATVASSGFLYPRYISTWVAPIAPGAPPAFSLAGWWRALVSQPLFLLLVAAWLWRIAVWARFLWGVSRLELRLVPAHPDLAGGLRFAATALRAFAPVALAVGASTAGAIAAQTLLARRSPLEFKYELLAVVAVVLLLFAGPLLAFVGPLRRARARGIFEYGELAGSLGRRFEERWLRPGQPLDAEALGAPDFSATTDLYSIAANVRQMRLVPFGVTELALLVIATLLPCAPLVFLVLPVDEVLKRLVQLLL